ncbi:MAG: molybdopterin-dependent oxidoreductase, partial [Tetrasphaera sp.]
ETMPPFVRHLDPVRRRGGLLVVDPRRSATAALVARPVDHLAPVPGTDAALLLGILHVLIAEHHIDGDYLAARTTGFPAVAESVTAWWPERVEQISGIPAPVVRQTARRLAAAAPHRGGAGAFILTGRGAEQSTQGTATVTAAINIALALGLPGRRGSGYGCLTGQGNGQGGREHGQKADQLPGYRSIDDPDARAHVATVWGIEPEDLPGRGVPALELLHRLGSSDGPLGLFVHGSNLAVSGPNSERIVERLRSLDLLVVCDFVPSETAALADVVLPVTQWAEEEGTMTNLEGRILRRRKAIEPPEHVRSELWIWAELARRLDAPGSWPTDPAQVYDELARVSSGGPADYSGTSHAGLDAAEAAGIGTYWPAPATAEIREQPSPGDHPVTGTPRPFLDRFATSDGRARLVPVTHHGPADGVRPKAPIYLVTGRVLQHYQSGAQTRRVPELNAAATDPVVEIHPLLADRLGVVMDGIVRIESARGAAYGRVRVTPDIRPDTVFMPFHWGGPASVNRVTSDATDPVCGMPDFKVCAVDIHAVDADFGERVGATA